MTALFFSVLDALVAIPHCLLAGCLYVLIVVQLGAW